MKIKFAVFLMTASIVIAPYWQYAFAEEKRNAQRDWSKAEKLFKTKCRLCHTLDRPKNMKKSYEEWRSTVTRMRSYAPVISNEQADLIIDYLSHHYGKKQENKGQK